MTPYTFSVKKINILLLSLGLFIQGHTQNAGTVATPDELYNKLYLVDSLLYDAHNNCDVEKYKTFFVRDSLEFYDAALGLTISSGQKEASNLKELCDRVIFRRELVKGSMEVCRVPEYGAVQTGKQQFYITRQGKESLVQTTRFIQVWKEEGAQWKLARIVYYDYDSSMQKSSITSQALYDSLARMDSSLFAEAYLCKPEKTATFFTNDLEFYHDKGGLTKSLPAFIEALKDNFCGEGAVKLRRELVKGTLQVYAMDNYGAIQTGEHRFYVTPAGRSESLTGVAKFIHIWQRKNGVWKISRVLSLDHNAAE